MPNKYKFLSKIPKNLKDNDYLHKDNVVTAAKRIMKKFITNYEIVCMAEMQSGKTEVMARLVYLINNHNDELKDLGINIDRHNVNVILCTSSINLKGQLKEKLNKISHKIHHLKDLEKYVKNGSEYESELSIMADHGLIIFDECHADAEEQKIIDLFRKKIEELAKHNKTEYYMIGFSATPYEQIFAGYEKVIMEPGDGYYGLKQIFESEVPLIFQAKNLFDNEECKKLFTEIIIANFYYIFRLPTDKNASDHMQLNIIKQFRDQGYKIDTHIYDMSYKIPINNLLNEPPLKPTVIFIKSKLRMGEYLNTKYVYLVHDDPSNSYTSTTVQSLLGRCCGYNKQSHKTIIYCDYQKAWQHHEWIENDYDIEYIPSDTKYIKKNGTGTKSKCIYKYQKD
jgi:hypothetical protein